MATETAPLEQHATQPLSAENTADTPEVEEQFAILTDNELWELTATYTPPSYENAVWPVAPEGFAGLLPGDKFK